MTTPHPADPCCPCDACAWLARWRAECPVCGEVVHRWPDGTVAAHGWIGEGVHAGELVECAGTGEPPARVLRMVGDPPGGRLVEVEKEE